jgi:hypothetical protein
MILLALLPIVYFLYLLFVFIATVLSFSRGNRAYKTNFTGGAMFFTEVLFTIIAPLIGFIRFDKFQPDIPFAKQHVLIIMLLVITASIAFWLARTAAKISQPLIRIMISVGLLQGIVLCFIITIHFIPFLINGLIFPALGFELLSPLIALLLLCREFYFFNAVKLDLEKLLPYRQELGFIPIPFKILELPMIQRIIVFGALLVPVISVQVLLTYACGQDLDALIKAFTQSHGFIFSINN